MPRRSLPRQFVFPLYWVLSGGALRFTVRARLLFDGLGVPTLATEKLASLINFSILRTPILSGWSASSLADGVSVYSLAAVIMRSRKWQNTTSCHTATLAASLIHIKKAPNLADKAGKVSSGKNRVRLFTIIHTMWSNQSTSPLQPLTPSPLH